MGFRITTWNVNGIRNPFSYEPWRQKRTFQAMFDVLEADIVVVQETKIQRKDLTDDMVLIPGWDVFFSLPRHKKGYSGVAIFTRNATCAPIRAEEGITGCLTAPRSSTAFRDLPEDQRIGGYPQPSQLSGAVDELTLDSEGRCVILEFPAFVLIGVYSPANRDETRDDFRIGFLEALDARVRNLAAAGKQVILLGDMNVIGSALDASNLEEGLRKRGVTIEEWASAPATRLFNQLVFGGAVAGARDEGREKPVLWDICRCFHPTRLGMNTCWDTKKNARPGNHGGRIDYILCTDGIKGWFEYSDVQMGLMGSDHCPVYATCRDVVPGEVSVPLLDVNPPGVENGRRHLLDVVPPGVENGQREVHLLDLVNPPGVVENGRRKRELAQKDILPLSAKLIPEFDRRQSIRDMFAKAPSKPAPTPTPTELGAEHEPTPELASNQHDTLTDPSEDKPAGPSQGKPPAEDVGTGFISSHSPINSNTPTALPPKTAPKRPVASATIKSKRPKLTAQSSEGTKAKAQGQQTLRGFFKPKTPVAKTDKGEAPTTPTRTPTRTPAPSTPEPSVPTEPSPREGRATDGRATDGRAATKSSPDSERVFDPIEAKESWSRLLGRRVVPRCEHDQPCISLVTKKPGINCGRSFYICPRPLGPSGEKEKDTEWRCCTFIWSSDWTPSSA